MIHFFEILKSVYVEGFAAMERRGGLARSLLEQADGCVGRDLHEAQQLRSAAMAYLGVLR